MLRRLKASKSFNICQDLRSEELRVPSGSLLLLGPLAGEALNDTEDAPPDERLCPFEAPTPEWRLGSSGAESESRGRSKWRAATSSTGSSRPGAAF